MINMANETKNQMRYSAVIDDSEPGQCVGEIIINTINIYVAYKLAASWQIMLITTGKKQTNSTIHHEQNYTSQR